MAGSMIRVRDRRRIKVAVTGRFAVPRAVAAEMSCQTDWDSAACGRCVACRGLESFPHLKAIVDEYRAKFVDRVCRAKGIEFVERDGLTLAGPQRHLAFVEAAPDPGPLVLPKPPPSDASDDTWRNYRRVIESAEDTQRALAAHRAIHDPDLVDYELVGHFLRSRVVTRSHLPDTTALVVPGAR